MDFSKNFFVKKREKSYYMTTFNSGVWGLVVLVDYRLAFCLLFVFSDLSLFLAEW
jgi:hypothetical protein